MMCVDKLPEEIDSFKALSKEADEISKDWALLFVLSLSGNGDQAPTSEEAESYLNQMANNLTTGQSISDYAVFDRKQNPIVLQTA